MRMGTKEERKGVRVENAGVTAASATEATERKICVHCRKDDHNLDSCPDISSEQLTQILVQLDDLNVSDKTAVMLLQKRREDSSTWGTTVAGSLCVSRLYLDTCTNNKQITCPTSGPPRNC